METKQRQDLLEEYMGELSSYLQGLSELKRNDLIRQIVYAYIRDHHKVEKIDDNVYSEACESINRSCDNDSIEKIRHLIWQSYYSKLDKAKVDQYYDNRLGKATKEELAQFYGLLRSTMQHFFKELSDKIEKDIEENKTV